MSLIACAIEMVRARGTATVDDLMPELKEQGHSREAVKRALQEARFQGMLVITRGKGIGKGSLPGSYSIGKVPVRVRRRRLVLSQPLPSVWALGTPVELGGRWPPPFPGARRYAPLGPWNEEATNDNHRSAA